MTDLLLYFAICFLASCVVCAALFWLKRPEKVEPQAKELLNPPLFVREALEQELIRVMGINEDTRPLPAHDDILDSFDYDELWEAAAKIPRESQAQREQIDKWEREAFKDAGEDYL